MLWLLSFLWLSYSVFFALHVIAVFSPHSLPETLTPMLWSLSWSNFCKISTGCCSLVWAPDYLPGQGRSPSFRMAFFSPAYCLWMKLLWQEAHTGRVPSNKPMGSSALLVSVHSSAVSLASSTVLARYLSVGGGWAGSALSSCFQWALHQPKNTCLWSLHIRGNCRVQVMFLSFSLVRQVFACPWHMVALWCDTLSVSCNLGWLGTVKHV